MLVVYQAAWVHFTQMLHSILWVEWGVCIALNCPAKQYMQLLFNHDSSEIHCLVDQGVRGKAIVISIIAGINKVYGQTKAVNVSCIWV